MAKRRFKESEIHKILQEFKNGISIQQIIIEHNISRATFYNWKAKYDSFLSNAIYERNKLEEDNDRLKRMFADLSLENLSLKAKLDKLK